MLCSNLSLGKHRSPSAPSPAGWKFPVRGQRGLFVRTIKNFIKLIKCLTLGHSEPCQILLVRAVDLVLTGSGGSVFAVLLQRFVQCRNGIFARQETIPGWLHSNPSSYGLRNFIFQIFLVFCVTEGGGKKLFTRSAHGWTVFHIQQYRGRYQEGLLQFSIAEDVQKWKG